MPKHCHWRYIMYEKLQPTEIEGCNLLIHALIFVNHVNKEPLMVWNLCTVFVFSLHWRHNDHGGVSNHQPHGCLLNSLFRHRSKENTKAPCHWPLCGEFTGNGEFPAQRASYVEKFSIWWRHHIIGPYTHKFCLLFLQHWTNQSNEAVNICINFQ